METKVLGYLEHRIALHPISQEDSERESKREKKENKPKT